MNPVKFILSLVIISLVAVGGLYVAEQRGLVAEGTFNSLLARVQTVKPQQILSNAPQIGNFMTAQTNSLSQSSQQVLGTTIEVTAEKPPLTQRAFEYARYSYCKAAVDDYEERFGSQP